MNQAQLQSALKIAQDSSVRFIDDNGKHLEDISIFDGYGLPNFEKVYCTIRQLAFLIRWECLFLSGGVDADAFNGLCKVAKHKFCVI